MKFLKSNILLIIILELSIICLFVKAITINTIFIDHNNTFYYRVFQSIANDSIIFFFIILLAYISYMPSINKVFSLLIRIVSLNVFIFYVIDMIILFKFANHLVLNDIVKYLLYVPKYISQLYKFNILYILSIILLFFLSIYFIMKNYKIEKKSIHFYFIPFLGILFTINQFTDNGRYIHSWLYKNFVSYNIELYDQSKPYSQKFIKSIKYNEEFSCFNSKKETPNIIILMVESLSSYQSDFFSGIKNWTPNLDKIAKNNISLKNFYANGFVTEDAEISMLLGELPIYAPNIYSNGGGVSFEGFYNIRNSLPFIFKNEEYKSEFITSSDLEFSNTGKWAKSIGFDYMEGSENPHYKGKERYHFKAAADEYLYDRVLDRMNKQNSKYFLFIKTVTSHAPFINPENNSLSEKETINYVDTQLGKFYKNLENRNFFENGMLIILGDHHPVIPIRNEEIKVFGEYKASSLVPMIISYKKKKKIINNQFQQTDIFNSLKNLISEKKCTSEWKGDFLINNRINSNFIVHRRGDQRGIISVFNYQKNLNIKLYGDKTRFIEKGKNETRILDKINFSRIQRDKSEFKFVE